MTGSIIRWAASCGVAGVGAVWLLITSPSVTIGKINIPDKLAPLDQANTARGLEYARSQLTYLSEGINDWDNYMRWVRLSSVVTFAVIASMALWALVSTKGDVVNKPPPSK